MNKRVILGMVCAAFVAGGLIAEEGGGDKIKELADLGPGVHKVKKDESGGLKSCVIVGQARISTVLGLSKGLIEARRNARLSAEKEFVKWVKTNVKAVENSGSETVLKLEGAGDKSSESGKSIETSSESISSAAEGAIRGLQVLGMNQQGEGKSGILTVVMGWSPANAVMAGKAGAVNESSYSAQGDAEGSASGSANDGGESRKTVPAKTVISKDADDFIK